MATPDLTEFKIKGSILEYPGDPEDVAEFQPLISCIPSFCSRHKRIGWRWGWF